VRIFILLSAAAMALLPPQGFAQQTSAPAKTNPAIPRGPDGKPDFNGVWQPGSFRRGTWEEANAGSPLGGIPGAAQTPPPRAQGAPPAREPAPYQPWAAKKVLESFNRRAIDDPTAFCLAPGVPRVTSVGLFPMQIVQTPQNIVMLYEYMNTHRVIPMNVKHPDDLEPTFMGDSVGHWEGDTLVVDVTGFNDRTWLIGAGTFHTEALHVTERYTRVDRDTIQYEARMEDPMVLTKPWVFRTNIMLREGTRLREYECQENNQDPARYEKLLKDESVFRRQ
jgi:hypothetical protein